MVGSVNDQFYRRHHIPGYKFHDIDYTWQQQRHEGARLPILYRENNRKIIRHAPPPAPAPAPAPEPAYTSGKNVRSVK